ncbi:MAG TPA: flagellar biosynthetic protein FliR [Clostridiales bacterium]|nr:flagellar biosynthetic protein FliR [Eubacteriales bacterium]HBR31058.1 flagellar biosynthetic protein FliR [Clostridiales bacterium]
MISEYGDSYIVFLFALTRISGAFLFNPLLSKRSVPATVKIGLAIVIAIGIFPTMKNAEPEITSYLHFIVIILKELLVGFGIGMIMQMFMSIAMIAGESIDIQLGIGMGRIYDPQSNVSMALTGSVYNILFTLIFFASNGHLTLIKIITQSCLLFPLGNDFFNFSFGSYLVLLFGDILILALKLAIPVIAIELLAESGLGVLMRIVPHINVFAVGLQVKLAVGLGIIILTIPLTSRVLDTSITLMFERIEEGVSKMLSSS